MVYQGSKRRWEREGEKDKETLSITFLLIISLLKTELGFFWFLIFYIEFQREKRKLREMREKNSNVREDISLLPPAHTLWGIKPRTWLCTLIRNWICHLPVYRMMLQTTKLQWSGLFDFLWFLNSQKTHIYVWKEKATVKTTGVLIRA